MYSSNILDVRGHSNLFGDRRFEKVIVRGTFSNKGNLTAKEFKFFGTASIRGSLTGEILFVKGSISVTEDVNCEAIEIPGTCSVDGKMETDILFLRGSLSIGKDLTAEKIGMRGSLSSKGQIKAEAEISSFGSISAKDDIIAYEISTLGAIYSSKSIVTKEDIFVKGKIFAGENVECNDFSLEISDDCEIKDKLIAEKIKIDINEKAKRDYYLKVKEIICTKELEIDYVIADKITCPKVKIGPNCSIREVKK